MASMACRRAWAGPRSARSRPKTSTHCCRRPRGSRRRGGRCWRLAAAGHRDVGRGGAGGLADHDVGAVDGLALGAVDGGGVGELDVPGGVLGGDLAVAAAPVEDQAAVVADAGDGPGLPVRDLRGRGRCGGSRPGPRRPIRSPRSGHRRRGPPSAVAVAGSVRRWSRMAALRSATCSRVSAMTRSPAGADCGEGGGAFDLAGVDHDLAAAMQRRRTRRRGRRRCASAGSARRSRGR